MYIVFVYVCKSERSVTKYFCVLNIEFLVIFFFMLLSEVFVFIQWTYTYIIFVTRKNVREIFDYSMFGYFLLHIFSYNIMEKY